MAQDPVAMRREALASGHELALGGAEIPAAALVSVLAADPPP